MSVPILSRTFERGRIMGEAIDNLIALAGRVQVDSYKRTSKSGKVVDVEAYTRSLRSMGRPQLVDEMRKARQEGDRTREAQVKNEIRRQETAEAGRKGPLPDSPFTGGGGVGDLGKTSTKQDREHDEHQKKVRASEDKMKADYEKYIGLIDKGMAPEEASKAVYGDDDDDDDDDDVKESLESSLKEMQALAAEVAKSEKKPAEADNPWAKKSDSEVADMADLLEQDWGTPLDAKEKQAVADAERRAGAKRGTEAYDKWLDKVLGVEAPKSESEKTDAKPKSDFKPTTATSAGKGPVSDPKVVEFAASRKKGVNASDLAYEMSISNASAMKRLMQQVEAGTMEKKGSKFFPVSKKVALSRNGVKVEGYIALSREI